MNKSAEFSTNIAIIEAESDRGAILVAAAMIDTALELALKSRLVESNRKDDSLFSGAHAPAGSLSAKIDLAHRTGVIHEGFAAMLHKFRKIRNDCAHSVAPQLFSDPSIAKKVKSLHEMNPGLYEWISGQPIAELKTRNLGPAGEAIILRLEFNLYFAYVAMKLRELAIKIDRISLHTNSKDLE